MNAILSIRNHVIRAVLTVLAGLSLVCASGCPGSGDTPANGAGSAIRGTLNLQAAPQGQAIPANGREVNAEGPQGFAVVAVSQQTQLAYWGMAGEDGAFEVPIPAEEAGNSFVLTIMGPDGRPLGPVLLGVADGRGLTGLRPVGRADLGEIAIPVNLGLAPIAVRDAPPAGLLDEDAVARLGEADVPVGVNSFGKGPACLADGEIGEGIDSDRDGLVDVFDADDDGDGVIDDLEAGASAWELPTEEVRANFFMNLKIAVEESGPFYGGTDAELRDALARKTVITFECMSEPSATKAIASARLIDAPAPAYLPLATKLGTTELWSETDYAFDAAGERFQAFLIPNAPMAAGDTFTAEVTFDDDSTARYSRMLNYIFTSIPRLVRWGSPGGLQDFDPGDPPTQGTAEHPLDFDGTQDLVLEFNPPRDENGDYLTGFRYSIQFFPYSAGEGQIPGNTIDYEATYPEPVPGLDRNCYWIDADDPVLAGLSAEGTYTVRLPKEIFADHVVLTDGRTLDVASWKIDITAECPSGNAAIMLMFRKQ